MTNEAQVESSCHGLKYMFFYLVNNNGLAQKVHVSVQSTIDDN